VWGEEEEDNLDADTESLELFSNGKTHNVGMKKKMGFKKNRGSRWRTTVEDEDHRLKTTNEILFSSTICTCALLSLLQFALSLSLFLNFLLFRLSLSSKESQRENWRKLNNKCHFMLWDKLSKIDVTISFFIIIGDVLKSNIFFSISCFLLFQTMPPWMMKLCATKIIPMDNVFILNQVKIKINYKRSNMIIW